MYLPYILLLRRKSFQVESCYIGYAIETSQTHPSGTPTTSQVPVHVLCTRPNLKLQKTQHHEDTMKYIVLFLHDLLIFLGLTEEPENKYHCNKHQLPRTEMIYGTSKGPRFVCRTCFEHECHQGGVSS